MCAYINIILLFLLKSVIRVPACLYACPYLFVHLHICLCACICILYVCQCFRRLSEFSLSINFQFLFQCYGRDIISLSLSFHLSTSTSNVRMSVVLNFAYVCNIIAMLVNLLKRAPRKIGVLQFDYPL